MRGRSGVGSDGDPVSGAATALNAGTIGVHAHAAAAGEHLASTAQSYDSQDVARLTGLGRGGTGAARFLIAAMAVPTRPPLMPPVGLAAGAEPVTGVQANALIHSGPGADGFDAAATMLDSPPQTSSSRQPKSVQPEAHPRRVGRHRPPMRAHSLHRLEADYTRQAESARRLSQQFRSTPRITAAPKQRCLPGRCSTR